MKTSGARFGALVGEYNLNFIPRWLGETSETVILPIPKEPEADRSYCDADC